MVWFSWEYLTVNFKADQTDRSLVAVEKSSRAVLCLLIASVSGNLSFNNRGKQLENWIMKFGNEYALSVGMMVHVVLYF